MTSPGQIGLIPHPQSLMEHAIQIVTESTVHHVVIATSDTLCVGAEPGGAKERPQSDFADAIWSNFNLTDAQTALIVSYAHDHIGTPYGYFTDAAIAASLILHYKTPKWIAGYLSSDYVLECAQLADSAYASAGIHLFTDGRLPGTVYPGSFEPIFESHGWMTK